MRRVEPNKVSEELWPGVDPELLKALHILTRDGALNADSRRKLKQVQHLVNLLTPAIEDLLARHEAPRLVDCGAGKGYLGFVLAQTILSRGTVLGLEARADLAERAGAVGKAANIDRVSFAAVNVDAYQTAERVNAVTALHACDTATDDAIAFGITHNADYIAVVPCCQAELAAQLKGRPRRDDDAIAALYGEPLHRREMGAHLSNVLRALTLQAHGYQVTVTELVGFEHSLKNELIIARRVHREHKPSQQKLAALLAAFGVEPKLQRALATAPPPVA